ncbi:MAG: hypothetical protein EBX41_05015 [Chitinophagia bacterium]|nr:hypothetical protein [Chitinophagia bacterium]
MNDKIYALLQLIDDPDEEVYTVVAHELIEMGSTIVPQLERVWESSQNGLLHYRVEHIIHRVQFNHLCDEFSTALSQKYISLYEIMLLIAQYRYPQLNRAGIDAFMVKLKKDIWLELNNQMSSIEVLEVFKGIFYNYHSFKGTGLKNTTPDHFMLNKVLESKHGNAFSLGLLMLAVCEHLDITLFAINVPFQFLVGYFHIQAHDSDSAHNANINTPAVFLDALDGTIYSWQEVEVYLRKLELSTSVPVSPLDSRKVLYVYLLMLKNCYEKEKDTTSADEINTLIKKVALYIQ